MKIPNLIFSTIILFISNLIVRILGFLYKIFLSHTIGESGLGIYHILFNFLMICLAFTTTGLPTSLSFLIAKKNALNQKNNSNVLFISTLYVSFFIALIISLFISYSSKYISLKLLNTPSLNLLVLAICPAIIVITLSNVLRAYYYGIKNVTVPAIGQLIEQLSRMLIVYLILSLINNSSLNCYIAILGISIGEIFNIFFIVICLYKEPKFLNNQKLSIRDFYCSSIEAIKNSIPITCNRMSSIVIHSISSIIIPSRLVLSGLSYHQAISIYGVISGMVMPLVYLPFTIGSALVVNLIPSISQEIALNNPKNIRLKIKFSLFLSLGVGIITSFLFYIYSDKICLFIFHNSLAGKYLKSIFLLPLFMCLNQTLMAILHSIGKELISSIIMILAMILQLIFIYFLLPIPQINIYGYIYTTTIISLLTCFLLTIILINTLKKFNPRRLK